MADSFLNRLLEFLRKYLDEIIATAGQPYFILSTLGIMVTIYLWWRWKQGIQKIGFKDALSFLFPKKVFLHKSAVLGYKFLLIDPLIRLLFFAPAMHIPISIFIFIQLQELLVKWLGHPSYQLNLHEAYPILFAAGFTGVIALLRDLGYYIQHVLMHKVPFFGNSTKYTIPPKY